MAQLVSEKRSSVGLVSRDVQVLANAAKHQYTSPFLGLTAGQARKRQRHGDAIVEPVPCKADVMAPPPPPPDIPELTGALRCEDLESRLEMVMFPNSYGSSKEQKTAVVWDESLVFTIMEDDLEGTMVGFHDDGLRQISINGLPQALLHDAAFEHNASPHIAIIAPASSEVEINAEMVSEFDGMSDCEFAEVLVSCFGTAASMEASVVPSEPTQVASIAQAALQPTCPCAYGKGDIVMEDSVVLSEPTHVASMKDTKVQPDGQITDGQVDLVATITQPSPSPFGKGDIVVIKCRQSEYD